MEFTTILTLIFIVLKLTNVIDWSWWGVLAPSYICGAIQIIVILGCYLKTLYDNKYRK